MGLHNIHTTSKLSPRSSKREILDAISESVKLALKECNETGGRIGNTRCVSPKHAYEVALGLAVTDARSHAGEQVPPYKWDQSYWPEPFRKQHRIPYYFLPDGELKRLADEDKRKGSWKIDSESIFKELFQASDLGDLQDLIGEGDDEDKENLTSKEKIEKGVKDLHDLRDSEVSKFPSGYDLSWKETQAIEEKVKSGEELTPHEKIKWGLSGLS